MSNITVLDKEFVPYISEQEIQEKITELAAQLNKAYAGKKPIFLSILNGSFLFTADLFKQITTGLNKFKEVDVQVQVSSEKGPSTAKEHAYVLKNRLVGEGLNPKRITVATLPNSSNNQIIFSFKKRSSLK